MKVLQAQSNSSKLTSEAIVDHKNIAAFSVEEKIMGLFEVTLEGPKRESQKQSEYAGRVIAEAGTMTSDLSKGTDGIKSVFSILERNSKMDSDDPNGLKPEKINGEIELKEVDFCYPSRLKQMIFVALRPHISLVSQEPMLFAGTILENISYGKDNATEAEIVEVATLANAHKFIRSHMALEFPLTFFQKGVMNVLQCCHAQLNGNVYEMMRECEALNEKKRKEGTAKQFEAEDVMKFYK
ncbi:hypothetical protein GIB67_023123 [Kingdonia uniflora]|uniref:ABC transporter domain-containing protein n=1 Tax=Kingdonia uniflora TaxID=39325 RepID=A0A7J7M5W9_9MAGN|nr:hypothetical protein GIB67_023123 [Kingdonia uniflora]